MFSGQDIRNLKSAMLLQTYRDLEDITKIDPKNPGHRSVVMRQVKTFRDALEYFSSLGFEEDCRFLDLDPEDITNRWIPLATRGKELYGLFVNKLNIKPRRKGQKNDLPQT